MEHVIGERFGRWVVLSGAEPYKRPGGGKSSASVLVKCDCGTIKTVVLQNLTRGLSKSCGCLSRGKPAPNRTHGKAGSKIYSIWAAMIQRCTNPNYPKWKDYGGRGISVAEEWMEFSKFYADMGERPEGKTLDRKDNSQGYSAANCKWSTPSEQGNNRRSTTLLEYNGVEKSLGAWAAEYGIIPHTLYNRIKLGWSVHDALTRKVRVWNR